MAKESFIIQKLLSDPEDEFFPQEEWSSKLTKEFKKFKKGRLFLNHAYGWVGHDLQFISGISDCLYELKILNIHLKSLSGLEQARNLTSLRFRSIGKGELDFSYLPSLICLSLGKEVMGKETIKELKNLSSLAVGEFDNGDFDSIGQMPQVRNLSLHCCNKLTDLELLNYFPNLESLSITDPKKLVSLEGLERCKKLKELTLDEVKKISDLSPIGELKKLMYLKTEDLKEINSIAPLESCKNLQEIYLRYNTNVIDGNMEPLKKLKNLKKVVFKDRGHYTHTKKQIMQLVQKKHTIER